MQGVQRHVVLFARAPRLGAVKRRLARDVGALAAWRFYRETLAAVQARLDRPGRWRLWLAVTPDRSAGGDPAWRAGVACFGQGRGDLGQRMARAFHGLPPGPAVIVGSDIPALDAAAVAAAFRALDRADAVFGPAEDGGYWCVGLRRLRPPPPGLFRNVRWSGPNALGDSIASLPAGWRIRLVRSLPDVDDGAGYAAWRDGREACAAGPARQALAGG